VAATEQATQEAADTLAAQGDALAQLTAARVEAVLGGPLVAAATEAVRSTLANPATPSAGAVPAITEAAGALAAFVQTSMEEALLAGFLAGVRGQQATTPDALNIRAEPAGLAAALAQLPVQGHTCARTGAYQGNAYAFGAEGVLGTAMALGSPLAVPPGLAEEARLAGNRAGAAVSEAFHTGAGAARQAVGAAISRAVANA